jgi:hypothetical protein
MPINRNENVVGVHSGTGVNAWQSSANRVKFTPLVIGELEPGSAIHIFDSHMDTFAFMEVSGESSGILVTRGASNDARVAELLPRGATVYAWTQNDAVGEKWQNDICEHANTVNATVKRVKIPSPHKGLSDWRGAGATDKDLLDAIVRAETPSAPVKPRQLAKLLDGIAAILRRYVVFQYREQADACALWAVHTWSIDAFDYTPYLSVFAAEKRSGKSRLLEVLSLFVRNARLTSGSSSAALIRSVDDDNPPTILLDEVDAVYSKKNDSEAESTRQFLNAGFRRGAKFLRCVGQGTAMGVKEFPAFCPKALSGIGRCLPDTVVDRSLPIELVRQWRGERAERFREREARGEVATIRAELEAWSQQLGLIDTLRDARPLLPDELTDRQQDYCEPLLAIAELASGEWSDKARLALIKLCSQEEDASLGVKLLAAIRSVFDSAGADKLTTTEVLEGLLAIEDGPWALMFEDYLKHGKLQSAAAKLSRLLKNHKRADGQKIKPHSIRKDGEIVKGFYRGDFEEAWERYLQPSLPISEEPLTGVTTVTSVTYDGQSVSPVSDMMSEAITEPRDKPYPGTGMSVVDSETVTDVTDVTAVSTYEGLRPPATMRVQVMAEEIPF